MGGIEAVGVSIFDIDESQNTRRRSNPAREMLKDSIRAVGLQSVLVTRPVGERFQLTRGGNTRLAILKELVHEGMTEFEYITVLVDRRPRGRSTTLIDHLIENDLRGAMTFADRATSIARLKAEMEAEQGAPATFRDLEVALRKQGYPLGRNALEHYEYAAKNLLPRLGALGALLDRDLTMELRSVLASVRELWAGYVTGGQVTGGAWDSIVDGALGQMVADGLLSADALTHELCDSIADITDQGRDEVRNELEELRSRRYRQHKRPQGVDRLTVDDGVAQLREQCGWAAELIAGRAGLVGPVVRIPDGMGFLVDRPPVPKAAASLSELKRQTETWLYLAAQSGEFSAPLDAISSWVAADSPIVKLISSSRSYELPMEATGLFDELPAVSVIEAVEMWRNDPGMYGWRRELEAACHELQTTTPDLWRGQL